MPSSLRYFRARHVATMTAAGVIADGCVVVNGDRVEAVGRRLDINPPRIDHDIDGLLTPGLVNLHTHLELTNVARPPSPGTFQDWLLTTMASMREPEEATFKAKRAAAVREGIAQCLKFGVTSIGDISQNVTVVRPILTASPLRGISFGECLGLGSRRERFDRLLDLAADWSARTPRMMVGISPHAPYTVDANAYKASDVRRTESPDGFWTSHIAETPDEAEFIADRTGPFADLYRQLGFDPGEGSGVPRSPVAWLYDSIHGNAGDVLAHVNYCSDEDMRLIASRGGIVAWCPRTHAYFGHPPHRWQEMLQLGIRVCVATDSCASSPDLNVMDDLRLVRQQSPGVNASTLWAMVTSMPGQAFVQPDLREVGVMNAPNALADFCTWPTGSDDPLTEVLDTPGMSPNAVWIGGTRQV